MPCSLLVFVCSYRYRWLTILATISTWCCGMNTCRWLTFSRQWVFNLCSLYWKKTPVLVSAWGRLDIFSRPIQMLKLFFNVLIFAMYCRVTGLALTSRLLCVPWTVRLAWNMVQPLSSTAYRMYLLRLVCAWHGHQLWWCSGNFWLYLRNGIFNWCLVSEWVALAFSSWNESGRSPTQSTYTPASLFSVDVSA